RARRDSGRQGAPHAVDPRAGAPHRGGHRAAAAARAQRHLAPGTLRMHDTDLFHEHLTMSDEERAEIAKYIWDQEHVDLTTIGIGSSTSHRLFAKVLLERQTQGLSSRFVVVHRQVLWRSPIMLTPFLADGTIDAAALGAFIETAYRDAAITRADVDSGAVIL